MSAADILAQAKATSPIPNHQKFNLCIALRIEIRTVQAIPSDSQTYESVNNVIFEQHIQAIALNWQHSLIPCSMQTQCCQTKTIKSPQYFPLSGLHRVCSITPILTHEHPHQHLGNWTYRWFWWGQLVRRGGGFQTLSHKPVQQTRLTAPIITLNMIVKRMNRSQAYFQKAQLLYSWN